MALLETLFLLHIALRHLALRWVFAIGGSAIILLIIAYSDQWLKTKLKWITIFLIILMSISVLFSVYVILFIDFRIPLPIF
jgi:hypothetical protein